MHRQTVTIMRTVGTAATIGACVVASGCASQSHSNAASLSLSAFLIRAGEETGYQTVSPAVRFTGPADLTVGDPSAAADTQRLRQEGFEVALARSARSTHGEGLSRVIELGSAADAAAEENAELQPLSAGATAFTVSGVPTSRGYTSSGGYANLAFREGRCVMLVGDTAGVGNPTVPVAAAVKAIYARTRGRTSPCTR